MNLRLKNQLNIIPKCIADQSIPKSQENYIYLNQSGLRFEVIAERHH